MDGVKTLEDTRDLSDIFSLSEYLKLLRDQKNETNNILKKINAEIEKVETALSEAMVSEEMQNFTRDGFTFYLRSQLFVSAAKDRREALHQWLKDNDFGGMVKETVNGNTLRAFVREQMEEHNDELPEGLGELVNVFEKTAVGIRKAAN